MLDLGAFDGVSSAAYKINARGQVIGESSATNAFGGISYAFFRTPDRGMIALTFDRDIGFSEPFELTDSGLVVGTSNSQHGVHPFLSHAGQDIIDLGALSGSTFTYPQAVSGNGRVVGGARIDAPIAVRAFSWTQREGMIDLGTLGGKNAEARAVNDSGEVVGFSSLDDLTQHAFVWTPHDGMRDLGTLGGSYSIARMVNSRGLTGGNSSVAGDVAGHCALWPLR
jgi:probable HAF family extracellular repeat protein